MNVTRAVRAKRAAGRWMFLESCGRESQVSQSLRDKRTPMSAGGGGDSALPLHALAFPVGFDRFWERALAAWPPMRALA